MVFSIQNPPPPRAVQSPPPNTTTPLWQRSVVQRAVPVLRPTALVPDFTGAVSTADRDPVVPVLQNLDCLYSPPRTPSSSPPACCHHGIRGLSAVRHALRPRQPGAPSPVESGRDRCADRGPGRPGEALTQTKPNPPPPPPQEHYQYARLVRVTLGLVGTGTHGTGTTGTAAAQAAGARGDGQDTWDCAATAPPPPEPGVQQPSVTACWPLTPALNTGSVRGAARQPLPIP